MPILYSREIYLGSKLLEHKSTNIGLFRNKMTKIIPKLAPVLIDMMSITMFTQGGRVTKEEIKFITFTSEERDIFSRT